MFNQSLPRIAGLILGVSVLMAGPASADGLKDEMAPTGKLRVAIAISPAGGAFWSTKREGGYAGVPVDLGKEMAAQLGVPVEYVVHQNSGQITDAASKGSWDVTFLPKDPERETKMSFGPIYEVADATYIVKAGSPIANFAALDQPAGLGLADDAQRGRVPHVGQRQRVGVQRFRVSRRGQDQARDLQRRGGLLGRGTGDRREKRRH